MWAASFHVWLDFHHVAVEPACVLRLFHDGALFEWEKCAMRRLLQVSHPCLELCGVLSVHLVYQVTSASISSSSPAGCCFLGTSLEEAPLVLAGFLIPLNYAPPVCGPPLDAKASFTYIFGQSLELGKQAHLFWDFNVHDVSACVLVPGRPFIQCEMCTTFLKTRDPRKCSGR